MNKLKFMRDDTVPGTVTQLVCGDWIISIFGVNKEITLKNQKIADPDCICVFKSSTDAIKFVETIEEEYYSLFCTYNRILGCYESVDSKYTTPEIYYKDRFNAYNINQK